MKKTILFVLLMIAHNLFAQQVMTPEIMWTLGRVNALGTSPDGQILLYSVAKTDLKTEKSKSKFFFVNLKTNQTQETKIFKDKSFVQWDKNGIYAQSEKTLFKSTDNGQTWNEIYHQMEGITNIRIAPDGQTIAFSKDVSIEKVLGKEIYEDVPNSTAQIYTDLDYRHWDTWYEGKKSHVFIGSLNPNNTTIKDVLEGLPYECPRKPFGGLEEFVFTNDSKSLIYVMKEKVGKEAAQSTNTDIFIYDISKGTSTNLSKGMMGYDLSPKVSPDGKRIVWSSMRRDGFEADKIDLIVYDLNTKALLNLTSGWDETVDGDYAWSQNGNSIYFTASTKGTQQLFKVDVPKNLNVRMLPVVEKITQGNFNVTSIVAEYNGQLITGRTDFNHATELFSVQLKTGKMLPITQANQKVYDQIDMGNSELRMVKTKDGHEMGVWVIYPPHFDANKKYPTLLYCQGGPQSALSQFYSIRWNFQLMAAQGYIIVAPNRRGMPGWGVEWNEMISKDWGGGPMQDYLDAIDDVSKESYVDKERLGCIGASYGGYSVFMLAGMHNNRFKTFIAHDGLFDMKSWYGTTEELWFANWDLGGNYWDHPIPKGYQDFNPSNFVAKWNRPIMIIQGGLDFRVAIEQGLEAFQAAQLRGLKSKLLYLPNENHWVLHPHNGLVWQREFFKWLKETL